jgi:hypothetical protein
VVLGFEVRRDERVEMPQERNTDEARSEKGVL